MTDWQQDGDAEAAKALLAVHRLGQTGMEVKLDRGFERGMYAITVEYSEAARKLGFAAARRQARDYASRVRGHLEQMSGGIPDKLDDASRKAGPGQKRDLESTFLTFGVTTDDGRWHDTAMKDRFRTALLRAEREWDQHQAGVSERRRASRRDRFRLRLKALLEEEAYRQMDGAVKEQLLADVTALVFAAKGREL